MTDRVELATIPLTSITVGERYRTDFGALDELAASIAEHGLISPLAVERTPEGYLLLAGERRLRALQQLSAIEAPVRIFPEGTSELERRQVEAAENFDRKDMDFRERAALISEIHRLHQEIHGTATKGSGEGWGVADTASLVGVTHPVVVQELRIAKAIKETPELFAGCKTKADADKVIRRVEEAMILDELAKRTVARSESAPLPEKQRHLIDSFIIGDAIEGMRTLPNNTFNWVELDPDFAIDVKDLRYSAANDDAYQQVTKDDFPVFFLRVLQQLKRVMADHGYVICWYGFEWTGFVIDAFRAEGFAVSATPGVWLKEGVTGVQNQPYMNFDPQTELFLIARKGSPSMSKPGRSNVFAYPRIPTASKLHPFERPLALMRELLSVVAFPGSRGLVPFLGSGKTLVAAQHLGMTAEGFELSKEYKDKFMVQVTQGTNEEWRLR